MSEARAESFFWKRAPVIVDATDDGEHRSLKIDPCGRDPVGTKGTKTRLVSIASLFQRQPSSASYEA